MSNPNNARRTVVEVAFDGADITKSIRPYLISLSYLDNEEDETDELQIQVQDRDSVWMEKWLIEAIEAASAAKFKMEAVILRENWTGGGKDVILPCGEFELDSVAASGPPNRLTIKGTSLPFSAQVRQTLKSKAWESYTLSGIANEIAGANGMVCMYESAADPFYERMEQIKTSDIEFLSTLCHNAGISLKATNRILVLFDQAAYESKSAVFNIKRGGGAYIKHKLNVGTADTQYSSCRVSYVQPSGKCISATAKIEDYNADAKNNQQLEITAKVADKNEAKTLAEKLLRKHNRYAKTASFTMPGNPDLVAGVTVTLERWGPWDGKYIVTQAKHTVGGSGYTVDVKLRRVLEGVLMDRATEKALENLVRVGDVTWTDPVKRVARVKFQDTNLPSGLLHVLANRDYIPDYEVPQRTEFEAGGSGDPAFASHKHDLIIKPWMPKVGATVLCLYLPIWNGDGFILGEIGELGKLKQWADQ